MIKFIFAIIFSVEVFALANRGGGPLLSHVFLTMATAVVAAVFLIKKPKMRVRFGLTEAALVLFLLFFGLSFLFSRTPQYGLAEILLFANAAVLFLLVSSAEIKEGDLGFLAVGLVTIAVLDTLIGYFIYLNVAFPRLAGTFMDVAESYSAFSNVYANFLLLILPLSVALALKKHKRITTVIVAILAAAILLSGLMLSFSRAAWIVCDIVFVGAIAWVLVAKKRGYSFADFVGPFRALVRITAIVAIAGLLVFGLQTTRGHIFETESFVKKLTFQAGEGSASASERLQFWKGALELIKDSPAFGSGALSFKYLFPKYQSEFGITMDHPHNVFLKIAVENGLLATAFFIIFILSAGIGALIYLWRNPANPAFFFLLGAGGSVANNLLDFNFFVSNFTLFILFLAVAVSFSAPVGFGFAAKFWTPNVLKVAVSVLCIPLLFLALHEGYYNVYFKQGRAALSSGELEKAENLLSRAQAMYFDRDLTESLVQVYRKLFEKTKDVVRKNKEKALLENEIKKSIDADAFSSLGEIYEEEKSFYDAEDMYSRALDLDPMNRFKYYYQFLNIRKMAKAAGVPELSIKKRAGSLSSREVEERVRKLLEYYKNFLRSNKHLTVLSDNPVYASRLFGLFGMNREKDEMGQIWFDEYVKFTLKYGPLKK